MTEKDTVADRSPLDTEAPSPRRRAGRSRHHGRAVEGDPAEEILVVAGRLFNESGIAETQMSHIAHAAGLRQSSVYYYYRRKEDILRALMARANVVPIAAAKIIVREGGSAPLQLYRFVRADAIGLCTLPFDANEIHRLATRDPDGFADYWQGRDSLERLIAKVIRKGIKDDDFRRVDPRLFARITLSNSEGAQNWFRSETRWDAETVGETLADGLLRIIMVDPSRVADVRDEAARRWLSDSPEVETDREIPES